MAGENWATKSSSGQVNSNSWDLGNTGKTSGEFVFGDNYDPNNPFMRGWSELTDFSSGKTLKDAYHKRFDKPLNEFVAGTYDPNAGAFQLNQGTTDQFDQMGFDAQLRGAAQMEGGSMQAAQIDGAPQGQWRDQQQGLAQSLANQAAGNGPSIAQNQLQAGLDANIASAKALQAGSTNPGAASRNAANAMATAQLQTNQQAAQLRAQEQINAQQALSSVLAQGRSGDQTMAMKQADLNQGANQQNLAALMQTQSANQSAQMQQAQMNDQMTQYYMSQGMDRAQAEMQAKMELEKMRGDQYMEAQRINADTAKQNNQTEGENKQGIMKVAGAVLSAFSDERVKENIESAGEDVDDFLDALKASTWDYTDEKYGGKNYTGIMAQDAEKSSIGRSMVSETNEGVKKIDGTRALTTLLASAARLNERVRALEGVR